jgi:hypothetical protein
MTDEEYIQMCALEDKYTKKPTVWELAQTFPDCRETAMTSAYFLTKELEVYDESIKRIPILIYWKKTDERYIHLQNLKKFLNFTRFTMSKTDKITESDVQKAKNVPIQMLYDSEKIRHTSKRITTLCPFHNDSLPSFTIYLDNNTFYCFGCHCGGDSIKFMQKLKNISFIDAVEFLKDFK